MVNNQLPIVERQIQALSHGMMSEAESDVQTIVNQVQTNVIAAINDAADQAKKDEEHARDDILQVINNIFTQLNNLESKINEDANVLLDKVIEM